MVKGLKIGWLIGCLITVLLSACKVGPDYKPTPVPVPLQYKEGGAHPQGWKEAKPQDLVDRGPWWEIFGNPELNNLEAQLNIGNLSIALAEGQYLQSVALVGEARAPLYPVISGFIQDERQKPPASTFNSSSGTGGGAAIAQKRRSLPAFSTYILSFNGSWEPDLWGGIRRSIESTSDSAQAGEAQIAAVRLSSETLLAQDYFELRTLDKLQVAYNNIVVADRNVLRITRARYRAGTDSQADIALAESTLEVAEGVAIDNGIQRAEFEHAIAVLIGVPPANFSLKPKTIAMSAPTIPAQIPSQLLERRPDIAQSERKVAAANAQIGVVVATFFPTLPLTGSLGFQTNKFPLWFTGPSAFWTLAAQLMDTILDGGLRSAQELAAKAVYDQNMAVYRQTVLSAFQNVEDNLAAQRILRAEAKVLTAAVYTSRLSLNYTVANYKAGTVDLTSVLVAQNTNYNAEVNQINVVGRQMIAAAGLISALGGGWDVAKIL